MKSKTETFVPLRCLLDQCSQSSYVTEDVVQKLGLKRKRTEILVLWRSSKTEPLRAFQLNTISYGTSAAPWMAIRTLRQAADEEAPDEETADLMKKNVFMDDVFAGNDSIEEAQQQIKKLDETFAAAKLPLT